MFYADSLGFVTHPVLPDLPVMPAEAALNLLHTTAARPWLQSTEEVLDDVARFFARVRTSENPPQAVLVAKHLLSEATSSSWKLILGLQGPPEEVCLDRGLERLHRAGIRIMTLAYQGPNRYGGGFACPTLPLTEDGRWLIRQMGHAGIILDLSHAGHRTARDALALIREESLSTKVCVTHTGCYRTFPHLRNLPDDVLKDVADLGGVVGLYGLTFGLHQRRDDLRGALLPHLEHLLGLIKDEYICIGSDIPYAAETSAQTEMRMATLKSKADPDGIFNIRSPDYLPELAGPEKLRALAAWLKSYRSGFDDHLVEGIVGLNFLNFLRRALP